MKTRHMMAAAVLVGALCLISLRAEAEGEISASVQIHATADFTAPLAPHGAWIEVGGYGRCWRPAGVAFEWRPYCDGYWEWTDCGWFWVNDEPWGWACYHYGRWVYDPHFAWVWMPDVEWAPAWVVWRTGGGCVGWAPLPPHVAFGHGDAIVTSRIDLPAERFVFVAGAHFNERITPAVVMSDNKSAFARTTPMTNIKHEDKAFAGTGPRKFVVNEGPGIAGMQKNVSGRVRSEQISAAEAQTHYPASVMLHPAPGGAGTVPGKELSPRQPGVMPSHSGKESSHDSDSKSDGRDSEGDGHDHGGGDRGGGHGPK